MQNTKLTRQQIAEMVSLYQSGSSTPELAVQFNIKHQSASYHLKRQGVSLRTLPEARRKHALDESAFDSINEESAYWIGLLMADGNVYEVEKASPRIKLTLIKSDQDHVERFRQFLKTSQGLHYSNNTANLAVSSARLAEALAKYGIVPRKSLTAKVAGLEFNKDFWRGAIDGDGTISDVQRYSDLSTKNRVQLSLLGSQNLMEQFALFIGSVTGHKPKLRRIGNIYTVVVRGTTAARMVKTLYADCSIALPRKLARAKRIIAESLNFRERGCQRCGHKWFPNSNNIEPKTCSSCRSRLWNTPR
jgi:predicted Zn-ribbon and HTH transcriptional regulator